MISFGDLDLIFKGHYIINTQKVSLVNAVKSLCAHYFFNQLLVLLDFGDLDFIFKVTPARWNLNFVRKRFYALCGGVSNKRCLLTIFILNSWDLIIVQKEDFAPMQTLMSKISP